jgi:hypothetical protein
MERPSLDLPLEPEDQVTYGWFVFEELRTWTLSELTIRMPNVLRYLSEAALNLNGFSKLTMSLATVICNPEDCKLLLFTSNNMEDNLHASRPW